MEGLAVGKIVHYVLPTGRSQGEHRPAIVVRLWGTPTADYTPGVQLQVFTDGTNDYSLSMDQGANGLLWATSVAYSAEPKEGTWHWPE
jgi:hypothetical protein